MNFTIEHEREEDGRWLAEVPELPGVWDVQLYDAAGQPTTKLLRDKRAQPPSPEQFAAVNQALAEPETRDNPALPPLAVRYHARDGGQLNVLLPLIRVADLKDSKAAVKLDPSNVKAAKPTSAFESLRSAIRMSGSRTLS